MTGNKHTLNGKRYEVVYVDEIPGDSLGVWCGLCDPPDYKDKKIYIKKGLGAELTLSTLIHEGLHACLWFLSEDAVEQSEMDITKMLFKEILISQEEAPSQAPST